MKNLLLFYFLFVVSALNAHDGPREKQTIEISSEVTALTFGPDSTVIAGCKDGKVRIFNSSAEKTTKFELHQGAIISIALSPDGSKISTVGSYGQARLSDLKGLEISYLPTIYTVKRAAFSVDGMNLLTENSNNRVEVWDVRRRCLAGKYTIKTRNVADVALSLEGGLILVGGNNKSAEVWDTELGKKVGLLSGTDFKNMILVATGSEKERVLIGFSGNVKKKIKDRIEAYKVGFGNRALFELKIEGSLKTAFFNTDGSLIVSAQSNGLVEFWDAETGIRLYSLKAHDGAVNAVVLSKDDRTLLTGGADGRVKVWDMLAVTKALIKQQTDRLSKSAL